MKNAAYLILVGALVSGCSGYKALEQLNAASIPQPPQTTSIYIQGYKPQTGNVLINFFVSNFSVKVESSQLMYSTARDGLWDALKEQLNPIYGFSISTPESTTVGFSDLVLFDLGINSGQQSQLYCPPSQMDSSSNDALIYNDARLPGSPVEFLGLRDCEKSYLGLNPATPDFAGDGIPDYLNLVCGLNPTDASDAKVSAAGDGVSNLDKCKEHIPIGETYQNNQLYAYQYTTSVNTDGSSDFSVTNIPVLNGGQDNFLAFYVLEQNVATKAESIYTAFAILKAGYAGQMLKFNYWATSSSTFDNQEVNVP